MILVSGFRILTAGGDPKGLQAGKATLTYSITGLVMAILSWLILLTLQTLTGVQITTFKFGL
jgi:hypothetical protein